MKTPKTKQFVEIIEAYGFINRGPQKHYWQESYRKDGMVLDYYWTKGTIVINYSNGTWKVHKKLKTDEEVEKILVSL